MRVSSTLSPSTGGLDTVIETFEGLRVSSLRERTPELGPEIPLEDRRAVLYHFANMMAQHAGKGSTSHRPFAGSASAALPLGLRNTMMAFADLTTRDYAPIFGDVELVGMVNISCDSIYDILSSAGSDTLSNFSSDDGSDHPSRECYIAEVGDVPEGHISNAHESTPHRTPPRTPPAHRHAAGDPVDPDRNTARGRDPIAARQAEVEEAQREHEEQQNDLRREHENLQREAECREARGGNTHARACEVFRRI